MGLELLAREIERNGSSAEWMKAIVGPALGYAAELGTNDPANMEIMEQTLAS